MSEKEANARPGIRATPSESNFSLQVRDEINDQLQTTFDDLIGDKIQAMRLKKQTEEQQKAIEKLKTINQKLKTELLEKNKNLNLVLNLFDIPDQISLEELERMVKNMKLHSDFYDLIAKAFGDKSEDNKDYSPIIAQLLKIFGDLKNSLQTDDDKIASVVSNLLQEKQLYQKQLENITKTINCKDADKIPTLLQELMQNKLNLEKENNKLSTQLSSLQSSSSDNISNLKKERDELVSIKSGILTVLGLKNDNQIEPTINNLLNSHKILQQAISSLGCSPEKTHETIKQLIQHHQNLKEQQDAITKMLKSNPSEIPSQIQNLLDAKNSSEKQAKNLKSELGKTTNKLLDAQNELNDKANSIKNLEYENDQTKQTVKRLNEQLADANRKLHETEVSLETTKSQLQQNENLKSLIQSEYDNSRQHSNELVEKLTQELTSKSEEATKLKSQVSEMLSRIQQAENTKQALQSSIETTRNMTNNMIEGLHNELNSKNDEIAKLQAQNATLHREFEISQAKLQQTETQRKSLQDDLDSTQDQLNDTESKLSTEISTKDKEIANLKNQLDSVNKKNEEMEIQLESFNAKAKQYQNDFKSSQQKQTELENKLQNEIAQKTETIAKLQSKITESKRKQTDTANLLDHTSNQLKILQSEYEATKKNHSQAIKDLSAESSEKTKEIGRLMNEVSAAKRAQLALENSKQTIQAEYEASSKHSSELIENLKNENSQKVAELAKMKAENENLKRSNDVNNLKLKDNETALQILKSDLETIKQKNNETIGKLTSEISEKSKENLDLKSNLADMTRQNTELNSQVETLKSQISQNEVLKKLMENEYANNKEETQQFLAKAVQENTEKTKEINDLKAEISNLSSKNQQMNSNIDSLNSQVSNLTSSNEELKNNYQKLVESSEQTIQGKIKEISDLKEKNSKLNSNISLKDAEIAENTKNLEALHENAAKKDLLVKQLQEQIRNDKNEIANLTQTLDETKSSLNHDIIVLKNSNDIKDQQIQSLNDHINSLNDTSMNAVNEQINAKQKLSEQITQLEDENNKLNNQLQSDKIEISKLNVALGEKDSLAAAKQNVIDEQNVTIQKQNKKIADLQGDIGKMNISHEDEIANIKLQHVKEISDIKAQHIKELADKEQETKKLIESIISDNQQKYSQSSNELQDKLNKLMSSSQEIISEKQKEISEMKEKHQNEMSLLQNNLRSEKENLRAEKDKEISDLKDKYDLELSNLRLKLNQLNSSKDKEISDLNEKHHNEISDLEKNLRDEMNQMQQAKKDEINELREKQRQELSQSRTEYSQLQQNSAKEISDLNEKHHNEMKDLQNSFKQEMDKLQDAKTKEIQELNDKLNQLQLSKSNEISELKEKQQNEFSLKSKEISGIKQKHHQEIDSLNEKHLEEIENMQVNHVNELQTLKDQHHQQILDLQNQSRIDMDLVKNQKLKEITELNKKHHDELEKLQIDHRIELDQMNSQKLKEITAMNDKHHEEIIAIQNSSRNELDKIQKTRQQEVSGLMAQRAKDLQENTKTIENLKKENSSLQVENKTLKSQLENIRLQIKETSKELTEMQSAFSNRSRVFDESLSLMRSTLEKIRMILGLPADVSVEEIASSVDNLMKNFAKHQLEVCKALDLPKRSPLKEIRGKINELSGTSHSLQEITTNLGLQNSPDAINEHIKTLHGVCRKLESEVRKRDTQLSGIAISLGAEDPSQIDNQIQTILEENDNLKTEIDVSQMNNKSLCSTLGVDEEENVDRHVDRLIRDKSQMERAQKKLAELVGVENDDNSSAVVYQKVAQMQRTQEQLTKILGTENIEDAVSDLHKQSEELNSIFESVNNDENGSIVYQASSQKEIVGQLITKNGNLSSQMAEIGKLMNVSTFQDIKRAINFLLSENERLTKTEADGIELRQQIADIIDTPGILDTTNNDMILAAVRNTKNSLTETKESLDQQTKLMSKALGVKGKTPEALARGAIEIRRREKEYKQTLERQNEMTFGIAKMLGIQYDGEKKTYGDIELAIGKLISTTNILKDKVGEVVGIPPNLRDAASIATEVRKLSESAKDCDLMRKTVGELEKSKQELQRIAFKPKKNSSSQTDPIPDELVPILHQQADELRDARQTIFTQENNLSRSREEANILRSSLSSIYEALGSNVSTPREAVYEIGRLRMSNSDLSKSVLEYQKIPIPSSALSEYQKAQMAHLVAQSDKLYRQTENLKEQVSPARTPRSTYSLSTPLKGETPKRTPLSQRKFGYDKSPYQGSP
ncbi:viral A-type inclusion protein, putative [Trichomonas vaginalis G3]|uniref:Viral A-type inclusion protein, putative n=1 Tax=Trichomonas vaginalis (strain ATCC PRA-98 / G3) TaxID=412133 RepID=A2DA80_TRIV3|nr:A-type inclusion protein-related family [Trichomonas vaginalis G3]EAY22728.1 viral A-type inclusion protein, putative [Trichomonas vaginalis G3]KAI5525539.1 A-type inclusion protein-related family [Trichomonas vaginalis G3]|eukprot:XP_001583714.1 viral A-type inclusion protein [Trichomonas vaginalis G3]